MGFMTSSWQACNLLSMLWKKCENRMCNSFALPVPVLVRSKADLCQIIEEECATSLPEYCQVFHH